MSDNIKFMIEDDGEATLYDDTYDITIHCVSKEEQDEVRRLLENEPHWIPVTVRPAEDDERKHYCYIFTCDMPSDGQEILVTIYSRHGNYVEKDVCYWDDGASLDSGHDWQDDVIAWMPLPTPFKGVTE